MIYISRSQRHIDKLENFILSSKTELYLELYPREFDKLKKSYSQLNWTSLDRVDTPTGHIRYNVLIEKNQ